jgi:hypothetical protein
MPAVLKVRCLYLVPYLLCCNPLPNFKVGPEALEAHHAYNSANKYISALGKGVVPVSRVADLDPNWIRIQSGQWIRIRIQSGQWIRIRIQEGKNDPQKLKKIKKFHVLKCWMFSFES